MPKVKLTDKQRLFIHEYLIDLNATQAAIRAGYSKKTAKTIGGQNLSKLIIKNAIKKALDRKIEKSDLSREEIINDLRLIKDQCLQTKPVQDYDKKAKKFTDNYYYDPKAATKALELLGKHMGLFSDEENADTNININFNDPIEDKV